MFEPDTHSMQIGMLISFSIAEDTFTQLTKASFKLAFEIFIFSHS